MLDVTFEDGSRFVVATDSVLAPVKGLPATGTGVPIPGRGLSPNWERVRIAETGDGFEIPADDGIVEVPWDRIRSIADPDYRAYLARQAAERARRLGVRIRALRLEVGLTPAALARKVGVPREVITNLEAGQVEPEIELIEHVAIALGKRLKDFSAP